MTQAISSFQEEKNDLISRGMSKKKNNIYIVDYEAAVIWNILNGVSILSFRIEENTADSQR